MTEGSTELEQLKKTIQELEQALAQKQAQLQDCLNLKQSVQSDNPVSVSVSEPVTAEQLKQQQEQDCYKKYRLCEANWADIPAGRFHEQTMPGFKMLATPVTFEMYDIFCAKTHQQPPGDEGWGRDNRPVINVSHDDAQQYVDWLSAQTGWQCQLPTEQQWEYACRAGTVTDYWYGNIPDPRMMVMGTGKTMPVPGSRMANNWGLYDMHGNVWEWTRTNKHSEYILCGGSWYNKANWLTSSARNIAYANEKNNNWGFRLIRKSVT